MRSATLLASLLFAPLALLASPGMAEAAVATSADTGMRCDGKLVQRGDRTFEVRALCGEPDVVVPVHSVLTARYGLVPTREEWQYDRGPDRLIRVLAFQGGRLVQIQTAGYGFRPPDRTCSPVGLATGITQLELEARCGEPRDREARVTRTRYRVDALGRVYSAGLLAEDWIYDVGSGRFLHIVTLINGRVVNVEQSRLRGGG